MAKLMMNHTELWEYRIIIREGYDHNRSDCSCHHELIHVPTMTMKSFHGSWYFDVYGQEMDKWARTFPKGGTVRPEQVIKAFHSYNGDGRLKFMGNCCVSGKHITEYPPDK